MITGELKNKIDGLWDVFAAGGLVNPLEVIEQITYLKAMPLRLHKPSLTTFLRRREQGAYMPTLKITIRPASIFVRNSE